VTAQLKRVASVRSFYRSANEIFGKIGRTENVTLQLIQSKCVPALLYGLDACPLNNKKLSYRRETARQLPTWSQPIPPPPPLATPMRVVESESHSVRTSSVPSVKRTLR